MAPARLEPETPPLDIKSSTLPLNYCAPNSGFDGSTYKWKISRNKRLSSLVRYDSKVPTHFLQIATKIVQFVYSLFQ